jgi:hypothetical protein
MEPTGAGLDRVIGEAGVEAAVVVMGDGEEMSTAPLASDRARAP